MNYLSKNLVLGLVVLSFVLSPAVSFADSDNGKNKAEKQMEKIEKRMEKQKEKIEKKSEKLQEKFQKKINKNSVSSDLCWDSFFRRVLPFSWLANNLDNINLDDDCFFKKNKATTTDTVAPTISNISTRTGQKRALVLWNTNERTTGKIYYSTSTPVNTSNSVVVSVNRQGLGGKEHYALLNNLIPGTTYYALIESKDKAGNTSTSNQFSFITKTGTTTTDITAPIISSINTTVGTSTVRVAWNTNELSTSKVYYGTTTPLVLSSANFVQSGTATTTHNLLIENLSTSTSYYMVVESVDSSTNTATSSQFSLTTGS